ncbi:MAG: hypothetical protein CMF17_11365 [Idiomarinaceae bacterium]|nr:hypothetical protein [Idiomarinaceae bacterium]
MTHKILGNLELSCRRVSNKEETPPVLDGLVFEEESESEAPVGSDADGHGGHVSGEDESGGSRAAEDVEFSEGDEKAEQLGSYPPVVSQMCGRLPHGIAPHEFLSRPPNVNRRSAEGSYSREYIARLALAKLDLASCPRAPMVLPWDDSLCHESPARAADMSMRQEILFKKLDKCALDDACLRGSAKSASESQQDPWMWHFHASVSEMRETFDKAPRSHTIVIEAAVFLIRRGLLNVKGTCHVNVKQARMLLTCAIWLQHYKSAEWIQERGLSDPPWALEYEEFIHVLVGGAGTGKTTTLLVVDALVDYFHGPESMRKSAPTNTAARKLRGDTVHALYKLPRGSMLSRRARLSDSVLRAYRKTWVSAIMHAIDEISFLPQDMLYQINLRSQEAKRKPHTLMGGLATILSGDFLQLPPVDGRSLAMPLDEKGFEPEALEPDAKYPDEQEGLKKERREAECRGGYALWRDSCQSVTCLTRNMRTTQPLAAIHEGMRRKEMTDEAWRALEDRLVGHERDAAGVLKPLPSGVEDPRLGEPPFSNNPVTYILHRHMLRVCQSYCNAVKESARLCTRLYVSVARDEARGGQVALLSDEVRKELLEKSNLRYVKNLPGTLGLYRGMRVLLHKKICVRLLLMNGCECTLEDIIFADDENLPTMIFAGTPVLLKYMPARLLLRVVDAEWVLPATHLPSLSKDYDRRGLFLLAPHTDYFSHLLGDGVAINIRRTHFPITPADARIVHSAQGEGFEANVVDMAKPPCMTDEEHWLANYVMISRARSLDGLLILRLPQRAHMTRGAPKYLADEVDRLLRLERRSVVALRKRLALLESTLPASTLTVLQDLFLHDEIGTEVHERVVESSEGRGSTTPAAAQKKRSGNRGSVTSAPIVDGERALASSPRGAASAASGVCAPSPTKVRRLMRKTSPVKRPAVAATRDVKTKAEMQTPTVNGECAPACPPGGAESAASGVYAPSLTKTRRLTENNFPAEERAGDDMSSGGCGIAGGGRPRRLRTKTAADNFTNMASTSPFVGCLASVPSSLEAAAEGRAGNDTVIGDHKVGEEVRSTLMDLAVSIPTPLARPRSFYPASLEQEGASLATSQTGEQETTAPIDRDPTVRETTHAERREKRSHLDAAARREPMEEIFCEASPRIDRGNVSLSISPATSFRNSSSEPLSRPSQTLSTPSSRAAGDSVSHAPPDCTINACLLAMPAVQAAELLGYTTGDVADEDHTSCVLRNIGNTCYLDALLHILAKVPSVRAWLSGHRMLATEDDHSTSCLLCWLAGDIHRLTSSTGSVPFVPRVVRNRGEWCAAFRGHRQQDAHEAFCALVDECEELDLRKLRSYNVEELGENLEINSVRYSTPFWRAFGGLQLCTVTCSRCGAVSSRYDMFHNISMAMLPRSTARIEEMIADHWGFEQLDDEDDTCENCHAQSARHAQTVVVRWPSVLVLHLKRWVLERYPEVALSKNDSRVLFESTLPLDGGGDTPYALRGVLVHTGGAGVGHYTSYVRSRDHRWYFCNDLPPESPREVPLGTVLSAEAYMLVYEQ